MTGQPAFSPWWWEGVPAIPVPARDPPAEAEFAVIGAGYTGLAAALALAEAGRDVVVLEAGQPCRAASGLNGGMAGADLAHDWFALEARFGRARAAALVREGLAALRSLESLLARTGIDAEYRPCGRLKVAVSDAQFETLKRAAAAAAAILEVEPEIVPRSGLADHLASPGYHGGIVWPLGGGLHPYKLAQGLVGAAQKAGAALVPHCPVYRIDPEAAGAGFRLLTPFGGLRARRVVVASNARSPKSFRYMRRRQVPVGSYMIATEEIGRDAVRAAIPCGRMVVDGFHRLHYFRASPDGTRILFGGRPQVLGEGPAACAARLARDMRRILPALADVDVSHAWSGMLGFALDKLPHIAEPWPGIVACGGYGGSGVAMSVHLGTRAAQRLLGRGEGATAFDELPFPTSFLHHGLPWFLPAVMGWYALRDRTGR